MIQNTVKVGNLYLSSLVLSSIDNDLSAYATKSDLENYAKLDDLSAYTTVDEKIGSLSTIYQTKLSDTQISAIDSVVDERSTYVKYQDGAISSFNIVSELGTTSIPDKQNAVEVKIGNTITNIGQDAFKNCTNLTSVTIPNSMTSIGVDAFWNCYRLTHVTIPDSISTIDSQAFANCAGLTSIDIPNSVVNLGAYAFSGCRSLKNVTIPNSLSSIENYCFTECNFTKLEIPNSITSIGQRAFKWCRNLIEITIPSSVSSIGFEAFSECNQNIKIIFKDYYEKSLPTGFPWGLPSLTSATWNDASQEWVNTQLSTKQDKLSDSQISAINSVVDEMMTVITFTDNTTSAFNWSGEITRQTLIDASLFDRDEDVWIKSPASVKIGTAVTAIGEYAFGFAYNLSSVTIPDNVTSIEPFAFSYCDNLTSVTIPDNVKSIGYSAFQGCSSLPEITVPNGIQSIGIDAFSDCTNLANITVVGKTQAEAEALLENASVPSGCEITTWNDASQEWTAKNFLDKFAGGKVSGDVDIIQHDFKILSGNYIQTTDDVNMYGEKNAFIQADTYKESYGKSSVGSKGFYVLSVIGTNKLKLSGSINIPTSAYGKLWSVSLDSDLDSQFSTISSIDGQIVTFKSDFNSDIQTLSISSESQLTALIAGNDNAFYCPTDATLGNVVLNFYGQHAEGGSVHAIAQYSHVEGRATTAEGRYSHAEGGNGTTAGGLASHAEGFGTKAFGNRSHSEGSLTYATTWAAHAEGSETSALGNGSHSEGHFTLANGHYSHAEGISCVTNDNAGAHAEGFAASAASYGSHTEGQRTLAQAEGSHAEGRWSYAGGKFAHAEGGGYEDNTGSYLSGGSAIGHGSHAEGCQTSAIGNYSHTEGRRTLANAENAHAAGYRCEAYSINSTAIGRYAKALSADNNAFVWQGVHQNAYYESKGLGTFSINPGGGLNGFYIGQYNFIQNVLSALQSMLTNSDQKAALKTALKSALDMS